VEVFLVKVDHRLALAFAEQTVVHKNAGQLLADGLVDQRGSDRRVDATGQPQDDTRFADLGPDLLHGMRDEILGGPLLLGAAHSDEEIADHIHTVLRMEHFGVELDAVEVALDVLDRRKRRVLRRADGLEARRQLDDLVAVGIPDAKLLRQPGKKPARLLDRQGAMAVLAMVALGGFTAEQVAEKLDAVANAEHRHAQLENPAVRNRRLLREDRARATGEDDAHHAIGLQLLGLRRVVVDLRVHLAFANTTRDNLRVLGTEIEDGDGLWHGGKS